MVGGRSNAEQKTASYPAHNGLTYQSIDNEFKQLKTPSTNLPHQLCLINAKLTNLLLAVAAPMPVPLLPQELCTTFALSAVSKSVSTRVSPSGAKNVVTEFFTNNGRSGRPILLFSISGLEV